MKARLDRLAPLLLGAIVLLIHGSALSHPLFADDYLFFDRVRYRGFLDALAQPDPLGNFWRPLTRQVYFWVVARAFAESAAVMHVINMASLIAIVSLLFALVRRWAGSQAAWTAGLLVAVAAAWDVPVVWGSGTQDLFAILFALVALHLADRGHHVAGALLYWTALLCKEVVVLLPVLVVLGAWMRTRSATRAWHAFGPYAAAAILWAIPWVARMRASPNAPGVPAWSDGIAAILHLPQVVFGIETGPMEPVRLAVLLTALACAILALAALHLADRQDRGDGRVDPIVLGAVWVGIGVLPIMPVASIWSGYYYAFALCGVGCVAGAWGRGRPIRAAGGIVLVVIAGATLARHREAIGVPIGAWTGRSHIDASYVLRSERIGRTMLASLKRSVPRPPPRSTFFFSGIPGSISWQVLDGPYVRWAYRDSSLRSYWLSQMTDERVSRGRIFLFKAQGDTLFEIGHDRAVTFGNAARALLQGDLEVARGALRYHLGLWPGDDYARGTLAWIAAAEGDFRLRDALLGASGLAPDRTRADHELATARERLAARDTAGVREALGRAMTADPFDARPHAWLADLAMGDRNRRARLLVESYAVVALAPGDPLSWRRWAFVQSYFGELNGALHSLARYRQLAPEAAKADRAAAWLEAELKRRAPYAPGGGQLVLE